MKKVTVIFWSGTGNTNMMAEAIAQGVLSTEASLSLLSVEQASRDDILQADAVAFGCPAMGDEVLEESEMEPFIDSLADGSLKGKPVVLFGSYDWGDGKWMRDWEERMNKHGAKLVSPGLIIQNTPEQNGLAQCQKLGKKLTESIA
ncbi:MAG: flavodoxin [Firmicutes bacterium]|nr:flavodoxin [Bacillota bacterium]